MPITIESVRIKGYSQQTQLTIDENGDQSDPIPNNQGGPYLVWADIDCFIKVSATLASDVTILTGFPLFANVMFPIQLDAGDVLGVVSAAGTSGTLIWHRTEI